MVAGKIYHWKHGWIPLDHYAELVKAGKKPEAPKKTTAAPINTNVHGTGPNLKLSSPFATAMAMSTGSPDAPDDPLRSTMQDNPLGLGLGFSYTPDYKGQKFSEWQKIHGKDFIARRNKYLENERKGIKPGPDIHPVIFPKADDNELFHAIEENGGFTYDPSTGGLLETGKSAGFAVAIPGTEQIVGEEKVNADDINREDFINGLKKVIADNRNQLADGAVIGGWYSPERNQYMVELSQVLPANDRQTALEVGADRNQESVFDLSNGENIHVGGTGDGERFAENTQALNMLTRELTPEEKDAAKYYSGPGYRPMNLALRSSTAPAPEVAAYMRHLDALMDNSLTVKPLTAYRGVNSGPWLPNHLAPGELWHEDGYVSVAVAAAPPEEYKGDTTMVIRIPAGSRGIDMGAYGLTHHVDERELLLPHGTTMRVVRDTTMGTQRMIELEVVQRERV